MVMIGLRSVWINADPDKDGTWSDVLHFRSASGLEQARSRNFRTRDATGNRTIGTILPGGSETWQLSATLARKPEIDWLWGHTGELLCFRDMHGRKVFGVYPEPRVTPHINGVHFAVALTVTRLTHSEVV